MPETTLPIPPAPDPDWAWFSDIDGTLIELSSEPSALQSRQHLPEVLAPLYRRVGGALALISGRSVANILELIKPFQLPLAGCHGVERRLADGRIIRPVPSPQMELARTLLTDVANGHDGLFLEDKGFALALHYRQAPHLEAICRTAVENATSGDLCWFPGKMVYEIKPRGYSKGTAVEAFMKTDPFRGRKPVFIGDDLPDEDGFEAVRTFGGLGILIGPHRSTKALFQFETVSALRIWLAELPL